MAALAPFGITLSDIIAPVRMSLNEKAREIEKNSAEQQKIRTKKATTLVIYVGFLLAYSITAIAGRNNSEIFHMQNRLKVLFDPRTVYRDTCSVDNGIIYMSDYDSYLSNGDYVLTVRDVYNYLNGTFLQAVYSTSTFDGDPRLDKPAHARTDLGGFRSVVNRRGFAAGQLMLLGGIQIGQVRREEADCYPGEEGNDNDVNPVPDVFLDGYKNTTDTEFKRRFKCYKSTKKGSNFGNFAPEARFCNVTFDFDDPPTDGCSGELYTEPFEYDERVIHQRDTVETLFLNFDYPEKGYFEVLPNRNENLAHQKIATLYDNGFIDYATEAVFIDFSYWNSNLNILLNVRTSFIMPTSGTVFADTKVIVADYFRCTPFQSDLCKTSDFAKIFLEFLCFIVLFIVLVLTVTQGAVWTRKVARYHFGLRLRQQQNTNLQIKYDNKSNTKRSDDEEHGVSAPGVCNRTLTQFDNNDVAIAKQTSSSLLKKLWLSLKNTRSSQVFWNFFLILQLSLFMSYFCSRLIAFYLSPEGFNVAGDDYINFRKSADWFRKADSFNALFMFFSWLRLFEVISVFASFSFFSLVGILVFFLIGSALSLQLAFGFYSHEHRYVGVSFMTTLRSIVGYIPFRELTQIVDSESIGFAFAVTYVFILVGILSNLVIASLFLMVKNFEEKLQVDMEYQMEVRRDNIANRFSNRNDFEDKNSGNSYNSSEESSTSSLNTVEHELLDHRRRKRRAKRRTRRKPFIETFVGYIESDPILGSGEPPDNLENKSEASIGDIIELNANGDVDRHYSFFNPKMPRFACRCAGYKVVCDMKDYLFCSSCLGLICKKKDEQPELEVLTVSSIPENVTGQEAVTTPHHNLSRRSSTRYLFNPSTTTIPKMNKFRPLSPSEREDARPLSPAVPFHDSNTPIDVFTNNLDNDSNRYGAYGVVWKTLAVFKLFGFERPDLISEQFINRMDLSLLYRETLTEARTQNKHFTLNETDLRHLDLSRESHYKLFQIAKTDTIQSLLMFYEMCQQIGKDMGLTQELIDYNTGILVRDVDIPFGQLSLEKCFETFEHLGLPLNEVSKRTIYSLFGFPKVSPLAVEGTLMVEWHSSFLTSDWFHENDFTSVDALPTLLLATISLSSDASRNALPLVLGITSSSFLSLDGILKTFTDHLEFMQRSQPDSLLRRLPIQSFPQYNHRAITTDVNLLTLLGKVSSLGSHVHDTWRDATFEIIEKIQKFDIDNYKSLKQFRRIGRKKITNALLNYGEDLEKILMDPSYNIYGALHFQHCLEQNLVKNHIAKDVVGVRMRIRAFCLYVPTPPTNLNSGVSDEERVIFEVDESPSISSNSNDDMDESEEDIDLHGSRCRTQSITEVETFLQQVTRSQE